MLTDCQVNGTHSYFLLVKWNWMPALLRLGTAGGKGGIQFFWTQPLPKECLALSEMINIYMCMYMKYLNLFAQDCDSDLVSHWKWSTENVLFLNLFTFPRKMWKFLKHD